MTCARCEELAEQVAYLTGELKASVDATQAARIKQGLKLRPAAARVLMALYQAKGRLVHAYELEELIDCGGDGSNIVHVYISHVRKVLGKDAILNDWGRGYRLSPEATARIAALAQGPEAAVVVPFRGEGE